MKKLTFIFVFILALLQLPTSAQNSIGVKAGYNLTNATANGVADFLPSPKIIDNYFVGITYERPLYGNLHFAPEFNYSSKGFAIRESVDLNLFEVDIPLGITVVTRSKYIDAPLLLKYYAGNKTKFYIEGGPYIGYALNAQLKEKVNFLFDINIAQQDLDLSKDLYNRWEIGGVVGAGISIPVEQSNFNVGIRYQQAFSDMLDDPIIDVRLRNYGIGINAGWNMRF